MSLEEVRIPLDLRREQRDVVPKPESPGEGRCGHREHPKRENGARRASQGSGSPADVPERDGEGCSQARDPEEGVVG